MKKTKNILFITWDSDDTSYLENLFLPIFDEIQKLSSYRFYVIQFTWASSEIISKRSSIAFNYNIPYQPIHINNNLFSKFSSLLKAKKTLIDSCVKNNIHYIMPRSIWPALICLWSNLKLPIIYDADGLAYLEKKETNAPLWHTSLIQLIEKEIINKSDIILTRSKYANHWLSKKYSISTQSNKLQIITNGVSNKKFYYNNELRANYRKKLSLNNMDYLFIYVGSLGPKYGLDLAITYFIEYNSKQPNSKMLILTQHIKLAQKTLSQNKNSNIEVKSVEHQEINAFLNAADIGFCFIKPSLAIKAVNPIKLNEYLMTGLPVILNRDIGDTEKWLKDGFNCIFTDYNRHIPLDFERIHDLMNQDRTLISQNAKKFCSLSNTAKTYISTLNQLAS